MRNGGDRGCLASGGRRRLSVSRWPLLLGLWSTVLGPLSWLSPGQGPPGPLTFSSLGRSFAAQRGSSPPSAPSATPAAAPAPALAPAPAPALAPALAPAAGECEAPDAAGRSAATPQLTRLLSAVWEFQLREDPVFATRTGDRRYNDQLPDDSPAGLARRRAVREEFLRLWRSIDRASLPRSEQVDYDILGRTLNDELAEDRFRSYLIPITNRWGFHVWFPQIHERMPFQTVADYDNYVSRLKQLSRYADEQIALMRLGVEAGITLPAVVLSGFMETIEPHLVEDPRQSLLYAPLRRIPEQMAVADRERLAGEAAEAIRQSVVPGLRAFGEFMRNEYIPAARETIGARALPDGRAFYAHRVRHFTTLDVSPDEVHAIGLGEVARIRKEMEAVAAKVGFAGDLPGLQRQLRSAPRFYADSPETLLKEVALVLKRMDGRLPELFGRLPRTPYGLRAVPDYIAPKTTTAYYSQPTGGGRTAGFYYVNTFDLKSRPLYELEALSLHEAVPGHHLQIALQQELENLTPLRRYYSCTAFVEGWALYAERLGLEVGFYQDPYQDFGRLSYEMWRACRLVVDSGIHHLGWSRQQAIDYMAAQTALSLRNIEAEVDRYIAWPGQALGYKMGELKIRELRRLAEESLGEQFSLRDFHDVVLRGGAVPLSVLEDNVRLYIEHVGDDGR